MNLYSRNRAGWILTAPLFLWAGCLEAQSAPSIEAGGVVNPASYAAAAQVVPGSLAIAFGNFLLAAPVQAANQPLPDNLDGLSLTFGNGQQAPLYYAASGDVSFQVPWELAGNTQTTLVASINGQTSAPQTVNLAPFAPGLFSVNTEGTGQGVIFDTSFHLIDSTNPAISGQTVVVIYATGLGAVSNPPPTGSPASSDPLSSSVTMPTVMIGGANATVQFSGLAPQEIGVYQVNALVPYASATGSAVPVSISIGGVTSNTVTMPVNQGPPPPPNNVVPTLASISPSSAPPGTGSLEVIVNGTGFGIFTALIVNGFEHAFTPVSDTQLTFNLIAQDLATAGIIEVAVGNSPPGGGVSNEATFIVQPGFGTGTAANAAWSGHARDAQHTALSLSPSQPLNHIHWSTPVDLKPQFTQGELLIHYGSPVITSQNTVIVPVKTGATSGFRVDAHSGTDGTLQWSLPSDYVLPPYNWVPEFGPALTPPARLYFPGAGGTVYYRDTPDSATGAQGQIAFYGLTNYQASQQAYVSGVMIDTPITSDAAGNIYFGFQVTGDTPLNLQSGIARISAGGEGTWISAADAAGDNSIIEVMQNCAPAVSANQGMIYVAVSNGISGYLVALNSTTLQPVSKVRLIDPFSGLDATLSDEGSATPTVGVDGDVYYGVLENPLGTNHYRGWLLHFDSLLSKTKTPGAFGWDDTASLVPSFMAPSYTGASPYLLMTKYNDYADGGGSGQNKIAVLDPNSTEQDPVTETTVMKEVLTILGPTPNTSLPGVKEWCINTAAVDPATHSILAGSEDGKLYRWDLYTNTLSQSIVLSSGLGEAYTPTLIGPDGTVYAINNSILFAIGQ